MLTEILARNWWAFVIRGVLAVLFGMLALAVPGAAMLSLVLLFAAYALADGVFAIVAAIRAAKSHERWGLLVLEGVVNILAAIVSVAWPALTVLVFVILLAFWALFTGGLLLAAALKVDAKDGRGWMILSAIASILLGAVLLIAPLTGAVVLTWWVGAYAIVFGIGMLMLAFSLKAKFNQLKDALSR